MPLKFKTQADTWQPISWLSLSFSNSPANDYWGFLLPHPPKLKLSVMAHHTLVILAMCLTPYFPVDCVLAGQPGVAQAFALRAEVCCFTPLAPVSRSQIWQRMRKISMVTQLRKWRPKRAFQRRRKPLKVVQRKAFKEVKVSKGHHECDLTLL